MTHRHVADHLAAIRAAANDNDTERAHALEDLLHQTVLREIATGMITANRARPMAALALTSLDIEFARFCA